MEDGEEDNLSVDSHNSDTEQDVSDTELDLHESIQSSPYFIGKD